MFFTRQYPWRNSKTNGRITSCTLISCKQSVPTCSLRVEHQLAVAIITFIVTMQNCGRLATLIKQIIAKKSVFPPPPVRGGAVGWGIALQARRTQVRYPMESLEFFIYIFFPTVRSPCDRIILQSNWVPEIFPAGKGGWYVGLTTLTISHADWPEIWGAQTPGTLWVFNRTVLGMLYLTFSGATLFLQTDGSQIWSYGPERATPNF